MQHSRSDSNLSFRRLNSGMDLVLGSLAIRAEGKGKCSPQEKLQIKGHVLSPTDRTQYLMAYSGVTKMLCVPHPWRAVDYGLYFFITASSRLLEMANSTVKDDSRGQCLPRAGKRALKTARFLVSSSALCPCGSLSCSLWGLHKKHFLRLGISDKA